MSSETFSLLIWFWHDMRTDSTQLRVVRADTGEEVHLKDGSFLLRVSTHPDTAVVRCFIRHTGSGREAYLQSGLRIRDFVLDCLLNEHNKTEPPDTSTTGA
jgi:hypothetical protein